MNYRTSGILISLLHAMFPGDPSEKVPAIDQLDDFEKNVKLFKNLQTLNNIVTELKFDERDEINAFIKKSKTQYGSVVINEFVRECLEYYFGHKDVIVPLTNKQSPLFPNETVLGDIDFDLLEPVYLRNL